MSENSENKKDGKKPYKSPEISEYGSVTDLTMGRMVMDSVNDVETPAGMKTTV